MPRLVLLTIAVLTILACAGAPARASDQDSFELARMRADELWQDAHGEATDLALYAIESLSNELAARLGEQSLREQIDGDVSMILSRWSNDPQERASYREQLAQNYEALSIAASMEDDEQARQIVLAVARDIQIKSDHCRVSDSGAGQPVRVEARTLRSAGGMASGGAVSTGRDGAEAGVNEEPGWIVQYIRSIFEFADIPPQEFPEVSSPTSRELEPGEYLLWVKSPDGRRRGEMRRVLVGKGDAQVRLSLFVPEDAG